MSNAADEPFAAPAPIIGITTYGRFEPKVVSHLYKEHYALPAQYVACVRRAGGVAVLLPPGERQWRTLIDRLDGIIFAGGVDVSPSYYDGNSGHAAVQSPDAERDSSELALARHIVAHGDLPALFVCRGMQVLNVALGGSLYEHLPDHVEQDIHRNAHGGWAAQAVDVVAGSLLASVMDATRVVTHSGHHQGVRRIADGLTVSACAADGVVEALEIAGSRKLLAVQWHPEVTAHDDRSQQRLFDWLVDSARESRQR